MNSSQQPGARPQPGGDVGGQLVHGREALDGEQPGHLHAAGPGDAGDVVAQQVDDHQVLGALLGAGPQLLPPAGVLRRVPAAGRRPLHRAQQHLPAVADLHEQLRAGAGHGEPAEVEVGVVRAALAQRQVAVEPERIAVHPAGHAHGQVALVGVAGGDPLAHGGDARCVALRPSSRRPSAPGRAPRPRRRPGAPPARARRRRRTTPAAGPARPSAGARPGRGPARRPPRRRGSRTPSGPRRWPAAPR